MLNKKLGLIAILASVVASDILAGTITSYAVGDVLLCFRRSGGVNDLVVDAGPISTFTNATLNQRIPITQFTGTQLGAAVGATNGINWSAFSYFDDTVIPNWTIYMTRARSFASQNTQSAPWSSGSQENLINLQLSTVAPGANGNFGAGLNDIRSTSTAVIEPDSTSGYTTGQSYHAALDPSGGGDNNFGNTFPGSPENITTNFATAGTVSRSDFYWIPAIGQGAVKYLGYFELSNNAAMTFVAKPTAIPIIKTFIRTNGVAAMTYKTGIYGTYTLLATNKLTSSALFSTWPAVGGALSAGDNLTHTVQDTDSVSNKFYILQGQ